MRVLAGGLVAAAADDDDDDDDVDVAAFLPPLLTGESANSSSRRAFDSISGVKGPFQQLTLRLCDQSACVDTYMYDVV